MMMTGYLRTSLFVVTFLLACVYAEAAELHRNDATVVDAGHVPDLLQTLAAATEANYDKIMTWEGDMRVESVLAIRGEKASSLLAKYIDAPQTESVDEIHQVVPKSVRFKIDRENNRLYTYSKRNAPRRYHVPADDQTYASSKWPPEETTLIVTADYQLKIRPAAWSREKTVKRRIAVKQSPRSAHRTDPRDAYRIGDKTLWLSLSQVAEMLQMTGIETYGVVVKEILKDGQTAYRIEITEPGHDHPFSAIELSEQAGFNRTHIQNWYDEGALMSETSTEFVNHQGVYLPKQWTMSHYYPDGGLMRQETGTIEHQHINTPVSDDTFSELNYLQDGDRLRDRIQGKQYTVRAGRLMETSQ